MIGRASATILPFPQRWAQSLLGCADIQTRQKWNILWPWLRQFAGRELSFLDAGCGSGRWSVELAKRQPNWRIFGVDIDKESIDEAQKAADKHQLQNLDFRCSSFFDLKSERKFDVVLSVASAHYLAMKGQGPELFECFSNWLKPGGLLLLLGPPVRFPDSICSVSQAHVYARSFHF